MSRIAISCQPSSESSSPRQVLLNVERSSLLIHWKLQNILMGPDSILLKQYKCLASFPLCKAINDCRKFLIKRSVRAPLRCRSNEISI